MHTRTTAAILLAGAGLLIAGCGGGNSYADKTDHCATALAHRAPGDKSRPQQCDGVSQDDYDLLNGDAIMKSMGVIDPSGNVDLSTLFDTPTP